MCLRSKISSTIIFSFSFLHYSKRFFLQPKVVTATDEADLARRMERAEAENAEIDGDDEEDEEEGMKFDGEGGHDEDEDAASEPEETKAEK